MTTWRNLEEELDAWSAAGQSATFWWRDDDAVAPDPALERLLGLAARHDAPLALAVIPARSQAALAGFLTGHGAVTPLQHGFGHRNHAPAGEKKAELGATRPLTVLCEELARGTAILRGLFGRRLLPVLVPPWNRTAPGLIGELAALGFLGLSTYGPRTSAEAASGLRQVNTHVDILRWATPRGFLGEDETLALVAAHLRARRCGGDPDRRVDAGEPTGVLSHHLAHDAPAWAFLERLLDLIRAHRAARLLGAAEAFGAAP